MREGVIIFDELLAALAGLAVISVFFSLIAWSMGFFALPMAQAINKRTVYWWQILAAFAVFLSAEIVILPSIYLLWLLISREGLPGGDALKLDIITQGWMNLATIACAAIALTLYCLRLDRNTLRAVWGAEACRKKGRCIADFLIGAISWLVAYPWTSFISFFVAAALTFFYQGPHVEQIAVKHVKDIANTFWLFWATTAAIVMIVPVLEELMFRGFLQTWLKDIFGRGKAIIITSVIFAFFHFSPVQKIDNFELLASLFVLSCFLGFIRERQRSLWASIGLHSTFNFLSILMLIQS